MAWMHGKVLVQATGRTTTVNIWYMGKVVEYDDDIDDAAAVDDIENSGQSRVQ